MKPFPTRWLALPAAALIVLYLCWLMIQPFVVVLLWAGVLAIIFSPVYERFRKRGLADYLAALSTTAVVVFVVLIPLTLLLVAMVQQGAAAAEALQDGLKSLLAPESPVVRWLEPYMDVRSFLDPKTWANRLGGFSEIAIGSARGILGGILGVIVQIFLVLFTLYYLLRDADRMLPILQDVLPLSHEESAGIFKRTHEVITATVNGVLVIAALQGFLGLLAFWVLGLSSPLLWGAVMFIAATIPMCGTFIVWVPAAIYLAVTGHMAKAVMLTLWGGVVIGMLDNILRPRLVGQRARLHELIVFFSVLGGLKVFGVLGLFVGPVVAAIAIAMLDVVRKAQQHQETAAGPENAPTQPQPFAAPVANESAPEDRGRAAEKPAS